MGSSEPADGLCVDSDLPAVGTRPRCNDITSVNDGQWTEHAQSNRGAAFLRLSAVQVLDRVAAQTPDPALASFAAARRLRSGSSCGGTDPAEIELSWRRCWNNADETDPLWYPQGIATNGESGGFWPGRRLVVASSYRRVTPSDEKGSTGTRLTLVDVDTNRYLHLVLAYRADGTTKPVKIHAGGVALVGPFAYVADTSKGFQVFDLRRTAVAEIDGKETLVLLRSAWYDRTVLGDLRFSAVDFDGSSTREGGSGSLLVPEYATAGQPSGRLARLPLLPSGRIGAVDGDNRTYDVATVGVDSNGGKISNIQGAAACGGRLLLARSAKLSRAGSTSRTTTRKPVPRASSSAGGPVLLRRHGLRAG